MAATAVVKVDIQAQADQLIQTLERVQKNLGTFGFDSRQEQNYIRQVQRMMNRVRDISTNASAGLGSQAQFNSIIKSINIVENQYRDFLSQLRGSVDIEALTQLDKEFEKVSKEAADARKDLEDFKKAAKGLKIGGGQTNLTEATRKAYAKQLREIALGNDKSMTAQQKGQSIQKEIYTDEVQGARERVLQNIEKQRLMWYAGGNENEALRMYGNFLKSNLITGEEGKSNRTVFGIKNKKEAEALYKDYKVYTNYLNDTKGIDTATQSATELQQSIANAMKALEEADAAMKKLNNSAENKAKKGLNSAAKAEKDVAQGANNMRNKVNEGATALEEMLAKSKSLQGLKNYFAYMFSGVAIFMRLTQAIRQMFNDFSELDKQFNAISVVTGKTMDELWDGFTRLNKTAQEYGVVTSDVVAVQKLFYQQGRSSVEVTKLTNETLKFAKISGLDFADATDKMTAALNAYNMSADEANVVTDAYAALSSKAAVNSEELAVAMSKVASIASLSGATFNDTSAYLAKIIATTREAPETAGTALKTVIARFTEIDKLTEDDRELLDDDYNFNNIEKALKTVGVAVKDTSGQMRGFSDILKDLGAIWEDLDTNQQHYIATQAAGSRQQSRFIALLDNWGETQRLMDISANSAGTGSKQLALAMDSIETKLNQLKATWQSFYSEFLSSDFFKGVLDTANKLLSVLTSLAKVPAIGPGLVVAAGVALKTLFSVAKSYGKTYAEAFFKGYQEQMAVQREVEDAVEQAKSVERGVEKGQAEGTAKVQTEMTVEQMGEKVKHLQQMADAFQYGIEEGTIKGEAVGVAQAQAEELAEQIKFLQDQIQAAQEGTVLGKIRGSAAGKAEAAAQTLGKGAGKIMSGLTTLLKGFLNPMVLGGIAIAIAPIIIHEWLKKRDSERVTQAGESTAAATDAINDTISKTSDIQSKYTKVLELSQKGIARTEEEQSEYQESLKTLQEQYPQLVQTLSNGILELKNSTEEYTKIIQQQRKEVERNNAILENNAKLAAVGGVFTTEEGVKINEQIAQLASSLNGLNRKDFIDILGSAPWGGADAFSDMAEAGLNYKTLGEVIGYDLNSTQYLDFLKNYSQNKSAKIVDDTTRDTTQNIGVNTMASEFFEYLEEALGIDNLAQEIINQIGGATGQATVNWAREFAAEAGTTVTTALVDAFDNVEINEDLTATAHLTKEDAAAFYGLDKYTRQSIEKDIDEWRSSLTIGAEEYNPDQIKQMWGVDDASAKVVMEAYKNYADERDKILLGEDKELGGTDENKGLYAKIAEAIGEQEEDIQNQFNEYSLEQIIAFGQRVGEVSNKYGQEAAKEFREAYEAGFAYFDPATLLGEKYRSIDFADVSQISQLGAQIIRTFGESSDAYAAFVDTVNKGSNILDRNFQSYSEYIKSVKSDVESIKGTFEKLKSAAEGTLELEDMFDLLAENEGVIDIDDFMVTAEGLKLNAESIAKIRENTVKMRITEYGIQWQQYQLGLITLQEEISKATALSNQEISMYRQLQLEAANGTLAGERLEIYQRINRELKGADMFDEMFRYTEMQSVLETIPKMIELLQEMDWSIEKTADDAEKGIDKIVNALEKLLELLKKLEEYADVDAYIKDLQNNLTHYEFEIEFSTNIDNVVSTTKQQMDTMTELINANLAKADHAQQNLYTRRANLLKDFGQYVTFDSNDNVILNEQRMSEWARRIQAIYQQGTDEANEQGDAQAELYDTLLEQIEAYRDEKQRISDCTTEVENYLKKQEEVIKAQRENITELEDKFLELLKKRDEQMVDDLKERYDAMKQADDDYLESVREMVEKERELRDSTKDQEDLARDERKLQLLKMSGGSATEIQQLEQEVAERRRDLADQQVDELLDELERENEIRAEDRDNEVEYNRMVLEAKVEDMVWYNAEVGRIMSQSKQEILNTWKALDTEYKTATETNQILMQQEMDKTVTDAKAAVQLIGYDEENGLPAVESALEDLKDGTNLTRTEYSTYANTVNNTTNGIVTSIRRVTDTYFEQYDAVNDLIRAQRDLNAARGQAAASGGSGGGGASVRDDDYGKGPNTQASTNDLDLLGIGTEGIKLEVGNKVEYKPLNGGGYSYGFKEDDLNPNNPTKFIDPPGVDLNGTVEKITSKNGVRYAYVDFGLLGGGIFGTRRKWVRVDDLQKPGTWGVSTRFYKSGGMVDYTGPAWVDGTPRKPEAFLSAEDTANISRFTDILSYTLDRRTQQSPTTPTGQTYYNISINVDELGDGYTVDDLMDEVEQRILQTNKNQVIRVKR